MTLARPIGILDEHPEWSKRLMAGLDARGLPFEKIDHSNHAFDPRDRAPRYSVIVNRTSPSSHVRGHRGVLFYACSWTHREDRDDAPWHAARFSLTRERAATKISRNVPPPRRDTENSEVRGIR